MKLTPIILPEGAVVDKETLTETYGRFTIAPLEKGWGHTIGNALRRALLSSIQGAAITQVRIDNVLHEFSTIPGVIEDVPQIILNIKKIRLRLDSETPKFCYLHAKGVNEYKARHLTVPPEITIANPDQPILTITEENRSVNIEMKVENGRGYLPSERQEKRTQAPIGTIFLDAFFSPVKKVAFAVENTRVGDRADYEKIILEIWTDGTALPEECLIQSATIIKNHMLVLIPQEKEPEFQKFEKYDRERERLRELLMTKIEDLELSNRALNCLKEGVLKTGGGRLKIERVADLVRHTEKEMLEIENFGRKTLEEVREVLERHGLHFGMDVDKILKS
ncbi:MAG: DNA-directed RNA polymerase subunit alpha [candidate division WOR-3 bacterium]|nr:DNA-directed RNA polymerase subunit alpha [candidate division WOR-3 bacterium]MCX7757776.1 DNA-directed RNA polymerase subunit alpha [candidate division WOR-3 bacterium]MDW7988070.1 DNA-directed RNA polymerase subunit alpha [candidate division WOR-3 bacterium]